jgi:hypothetical protein
MKIYQKYSGVFSEYSKWLNHNSPEGCAKEMQQQQHGKVLVKFTEKLLSSGKVQHDVKLQKLGVSLCSYPEAYLAFKRAQSASSKS